MSKTAVIGIDLGGTKLAGAVFTENGRIIARILVPLGGREGRAVARLIRDKIAELFELADANHIKVRAIGISVPGIYSSQSGKVWAPNIPGWKNFPLWREIKSSLGKQHVPVVIDSDRACYILGETWRGSAKGYKNAIFVAVGTGIGAGILVDGKILRGAHDIAGAIGWLALDRPFRREYIPCGCFEHHASGEGLAKVAKEFLNQQPTRSQKRGKPGWTASEVFAMHGRGDRVAKEVLNQAIQFWGMATANLVSLFDPDTIIFGGGVFGPAGRFLEEIRAEAKRWAQPISMRKVRLRVSTLGADAGLYGAAYQALAEL